MHATCRKCGHILSVPPEFAGRRLKCPKCMAMIADGQSQPDDKGLRLPIVRLIGLTRRGKKAPAMLSIQLDQLVITGGDMDEPVTVAAKEAKKRVTIFWQVGGWAMGIKTWSGTVIFLVDSEVAKLVRGWYFLAAGQERAREWGRVTASPFFRVVLGKPAQVVCAVLLIVTVSMEFGVGAGIGLLLLSVALGPLVWCRAQGRERLKRALLERLG